MKFPFVLFVVLVAGCSQGTGISDAPSSPESSKASPEATSAAQPTKSAQDMKMSEAEHAAMTAGEQPTQAAAVAKTDGTVEAMDASAGKITIAHGPVAALKWPAMTMAFKATPEQLASVKVGQKVQFEFTSQGMDAAITSIGPAE